VACQSARFERFGGILRTLLDQVKATRGNRVIALSVLLALSACSTLQEPAPLPARNQHPFQLLRAHPLPRAARAVPSGEVELASSLDWTSLWLSPGDGKDRIQLDGELLRADLMARFGLGHRLDLDVGIPVVHTSTGVLDGLVIFWHDALGLPQGGRDTVPRDDFNVRIEKFNGSTLTTIDSMPANATSVGDLPVFLNWFPVESDDGLCLGVRGGIELPTGDADRGFGSGGVDFALGALAQYNGGTWSGFAWYDRSWVHTPDQLSRAGLEFPVADTFGIGAQFGLSKNLSAIVQYEWEDPLLANLDSVRANRTHLLVWIAGRYRFSDRFGLDLGFSEDPITNLSTDVTFHLGFRVRL